MVVYAIQLHESVTGAHVSAYPEARSHLPPHCTGFECPASCIELTLVLYFTYGNTHVSVLFSHIIPPLPSPKESKSLFFTSVCFAALHIGSSLPYF